MNAGLAPGMPLADALSFVPGLATAAAEPAKDAASLRRLAEWCGRYSPWTAPDGADGIKIEITGCAHLWGGEEALAADLVARLGAKASPLISLSPTRWVRPGPMPDLAKPAGGPRSCPREMHAPLSLRCRSRRCGSTRRLAQGLRRVGLKRIGDLYAMPRSALACRFGEAVAQRLDQAFDDLPEPLSPLGETPSRRVRLSFAEPIADPADLALAAERLAQDLVTRLAREGTGARRLVLAFHRVDGRVERLTLGTARPSRDPHHIAALFKERIDTIDPGLGIEDVILAAFAVERLGPEQIGLPRPHPNPPPQAGEERGGGSATVWAGEGTEEGSGDSISVLFDRLGNRLGLAAVSRIEARESHIPERASIKAPVAEPSSTQISGLGPSSPAMRKRVSSAARWGGDNGVETD